MDQVARRVRERARPVGLPAPPLMHSTALMFAFTILNQGGCVVTLPSRRFDAVEMFDAVEREGVNAVAIVGDAFAAPILAALDERPGRWDTSSLALLASAGAMLPAEPMRRLPDHPPGTGLRDVLGASQSHGMRLAGTSAGAYHDELLAEFVQAGTQFIGTPRM